MTSDSKAGTVSKLIDRTWHDGDFTVVDEILAPDFVDHTAGFPESHGPEDYKSFVRAIKEAFPDCRHPIEEMVVGDTTVAIRWRFTGTHEGRFLGIAPTGREVDIVGLELFRFEDGQIIESWATPDLLGLIRQLGVESLDDLEMRG